MTLPHKTRLQGQWLIAYYVFGAAAWFAIGMALHAHGPAPKDLVEGLFLSLLKAVVWIVPALLLTRFVLREAVAPDLGLSPVDNPLSLWRAIAVSVVFLVLTGGLQFLIGGGRSSHEAPPVFPALALNAVNSTIEEISFRGFILGHLARRHPFWRANFLQAALFLLVHWLGWFSRGGGWQVVPMSIMLTTFALVLGWTTRLSGSVWLAIVVHTINNVLASQLGGGRGA